MSVKITELPILDSLADNDIVAGVDVSGNVTSKIEMSTLKNYIDTNTQYTAGTNIDITDNVISAPNVYNKTETDGLIDDLETNINEQLEEKDEQIEELQSEVDSLSTIFNAFPTESGEGESLTLDDTAEVKFKKFDLKGNTEQSQYTGANILDVQNLTVQSISAMSTIEKGNNYIHGTTLVQEWAGVQLVCTLTAGTYYYKHFTKLNSDNANTVALGSFRLNKNSPSGELVINQNLQATYINKINEQTITIPSDGTYVFVYRFGNAAATERDIEIQDIILSKTDTPYEPYVGGTASPNPSYPQPVNVVSGDNEINVCGKNILKFPDSIRTFSGGVNLETSNNTKFTFTGTSSAAYYNSLALDYYLPKGTYTMSSTNNNFRYYFWFRDKNNAITYANVHLNNSSRTFTLEEDSETIIVGVEGLTSGTTYNIETYFQLEKGDSATTYEPYQGNTYNIDLPVENLFDKETAQLNVGINTSNGNTYNDSNLFSSDYIPISINTPYVANSASTTGNRVFGACYDSNKVYLGAVSTGVGERTFTVTITNAKYVRITGQKVNIDTYQIEEGSKQNSYTPYGQTPIELCKIGNYQDYFYKDNGKWYLHKEIGKVVLDGTQAGARRETSTNNYYRFTITVDNVLRVANSDTKGAIVCDKFVTNTLSNTYRLIQGINAGITSTNYYRDICIYCDETKTWTWDEFKTWLASNTPKVYFALATPIGTEITYQPLIDQLNLLEKAMSKDSQTNISQVNNDLGFIIYAEAIKSLENVLDRIELLES